MHSLPFSREKSPLPSLADVAAQAGVSLSTASRALDPVGEHPIKLLTRRKVEETAERLGYRPNPLARGLRAQRMNTAAVVVHDIADPYFAEIVRGVSAEASAAGLLTMVCSSDRDPETELRYVDMLRHHRVAAILFAAGGLDDRGYRRRMAEHVAGIRSYGGAVVALGPRMERWPAEVPDNRGGSRLMTEYLLGLGHHAIGLVTGSENVHTSLEREAGHVEVMVAAGLTPIVERGDFSPAGGAAATARLLDAGHQVSALFVASDTMAVGALTELRRRGIQVPGDVSVAGFGDVPGWEYRNPALTTVHVDLAAIGAAGARRALVQLSGADGPPRVRVHPVRLVLRESTRRLTSAAAAAS